MFSTSTLLRLKDILERITSGKEISIQERLYVEQCADKNQSMATCLRKARRLQQKTEASNSIDYLLNGLELRSTDPDSSYRPKLDDLGEWFSGAPSWLGRS